jgi:hypothetical protein
VCAGLPRFGFWVRAMSASVAPIKYMTNTDMMVGAVADFMAHQGQTPGEAPVHSVSWGVGWVPAREILWKVVWKWLGKAEREPERFGG